MPRVRACLKIVGCDEAGNPKFRAVDDFTRSGVNACTAPAEKLKCDSLDTFFNDLRLMDEMFEVISCAFSPLCE
jgi:hypothetical protein